MIIPPTFTKEGSNEVAFTPFGTYVVGPSKSPTGSPFWWSGGRNGYRPCSSVEEGKMFALADYTEKAKQIIQEEYSLADLAVIRSVSYERSKMEGHDNRPEWVDFYSNIYSQSGAMIRERIHKFAEEFNIKEP